MSEANPPFPVIVINLPENADRRAHMAAELDVARLPFSISPGARADALPREVWPWFCDADGRVVAPMKAGEVGCDAAHLQVHLALARGDVATPALVLEDDLRLAADFADACRAALAAMPADWDILRLSNAPKRATLTLAQLGGGRALIRYSKVPNSAAAYLLNRSGARKLARPGQRTYVIDEYLRRPWLAGLNTFGVDPPPASDNVFASSIDAISARHLGEGRRKPVSRPRADELMALPHRLAFNISHLGAKDWARCAARNAAARMRLGGR